MRRLSSLPVVCLLAFAMPALAQSTANADICASSDANAVSPEQRIAACTAVIAESKDGAPQAMAAAMVNRGNAYW